MKKNIQNRNYITSERPNLFEPNVYISMVVTFSGTVSQKELEHAVKTAYAYNEAAMSNIPPKVSYTKKVVGIEPMANSCTWYITI